jgi:Arc/MetJ-type ribon-helix-helix transcriptional regulator
MNVQLSPAHQKWLADQVSAGTFASVDDAVAWAIEGMMRLTDDDLTWARPYLENGEASLARGEGIPGDDFLARLDGRLDALR